MNRQAVEEYIRNEYAVTPDYLWKGDNDTAALRHRGSKKWFGIFMRIPRTKLGLSGEGLVDIINIKLDPDFVQALVDDETKLVFPAYHMNKKYWASAVLDEKADKDLIQSLIHESFGLTL